MKIAALCAAVLTLWSLGCSRQPGSGTAAASGASQGAGAGTAGTVSPATAANDPAPGPASTAAVAPKADPVSNIPAGTRLRVRLASSLDTKRNQAGSPFMAVLDDPIVSGDRVIVPEGTEFRGHVVEARRSGRLKGRAVLEVALDSFQLRGNIYRISTSDAERLSGRHRNRNIAIIGGGSDGGAAIGAAAGGGVGALIGAGAGAAAGTTGALITGKKDVRLPVETRIVFVLKHPVELRGA